MGTINIQSTDLSHKASLTFTGTSDVTVDMGKLFPSGGIILWSGSIASIPSGWALCDGNNGTPNLKDRFVVGAGNSYAVGATGGAASHTHSVSGTSGATTLSGSQIPTHRHTNSGQGGAVNYINGDPGETYTMWDGGAYLAKITNPTIYNAGTSSSHTHSFSAATDSQGTLPPYYALAYIMKL